MLKAEHQQEQMVRENAANCEQLKSELERIQQRQRELDLQKGARPKERLVTGSRPESRMGLDEAPRSKGRFNLDRAAQEHMNEGLEVWIPTDSTSSLRGLERQPIRPLMDVALPGYTPSSTPSSSQVSGSSSRLKELNERLQLRNRESPARVELPPTCLGTVVLGQGSWDSGLGTLIRSTGTALNSLGTVKRKLGTARRSGVTILKGLETGRIS